MLVRFFPEADESEEPHGEILMAARDLGELYPEEWRALLAEATHMRSERGKMRRRHGGRRRRRR